MITAVLEVYSIKDGKLFSSYHDSEEEADKTGLDFIEAKRKECPGGDADFYYNVINLGDLNEKDVD